MVLKIVKIVISVSIGGNICSSSMLLSMVLLKWNFSCVKV